MWHRLTPVSWEAAWENTAPQINASFPLAVRSSEECVKWWFVLQYKARGETAAHKRDVITKDASLTLRNTLCVFSSLTLPAVTCDLWPSWISGLTWVRRTATSLGSASVSCPPENRAVGTFMSCTRYWGGVDWGRDTWRTDRQTGRK